MEKVDPEKQKAFKKWEEDRLESTSTMIVEHFPKTMVFYFLAVAFCATRAPTDFVVTAAYFALIVRIIQVFGYYCN